MLRFEVHQIYLENKERYFLPLPKLNEVQLLYLADHLEERGFLVSTGPRIQARKGGSRILIDHVGLAWSSEDLLDAIAPAIPKLLRFKKESAPINPYYDMKRIKNAYVVRLLTRMESSGLWAALRSSGQCGLTPDEGLVINDLLRSTDGELECVTDYPTDGSSGFQIGHHAYYRSKVSAEELATTIRTLSSVSQKNCYLPKRSVLTIRTRSQLSEGLPELGEWCFLDVPKTSKSSVRRAKPGPR